MRNGIGVAALIVIGGLATGCGGSGSESVKETNGTAAATTTAQTAAPTTTVESTVPSLPAPTNAQVKDAFEAFINERASSGVMLAQSVTDLTVSDGVVTWYRMAVFGDVWPNRPISSRSVAPVSAASTPAQCRRS